MKQALILLLLILILGVSVLYLNSRPTSPDEEFRFYPEIARDIKDQSAVEVMDQSPTDPVPFVTVIADNLEIPWEVVHLPDGELLVTERPGRVLLLREGLAFEIDGVRHIGEGGLLGATLHPEFAENGFVYLYQTTESAAGLINRVVRYHLSGTEFTFDRVILDGIPGARYHDGGRIAFGPDGYLYVTTGDAGDTAAAQDPESLPGSILRITSDGEIPTDNPFRNAVFTYGHRNSQGLAWDDTGQLYSTEHGRSGVVSGFDEFNRISSGANYGWPEYEGDEIGIGTDGPILHSGADTTWAPGDLAYLNGVFYFTGLRGETLYTVTLDETGAVKDRNEYFVGDFGRLRAVSVGPDGFLYITTSNRDGRGQLSSENDDLILRIDPAQL